jgi:predicted nuclease with TOPRIM domain
MSADFAGIGKTVREITQFILKLIKLGLSWRFTRERLRLENEEQSLKNQAQRLKNDEQELKNRDRELKHMMSLLAAEERFASSERPQQLPPSTPVKKL